MVLEELFNNVVEGERISARLMIARLIIGKNLVNVISAYAPQIGRSAEEKDNFWYAVDGLMVDINKDKIVVFGEDSNGHA